MRAIRLLTAVLWIFGTVKMTFFSVRPSGVDCPSGCGWELREHVCRSSVTWVTSLFWFRFVYTCACRFNSRNCSSSINPFRDLSVTCWRVTSPCCCHISVLMTARVRISVPWSPIIVTVFGDLVTGRGLRHGYNRITYYYYCD